MFKESLISNLPGDPTGDQKNAIAMLEKFVLEHYPCAILTGHAGSGKTSLLAAFVKTLHAMEKNYYLLAPTGRAAKVVMDYSNHLAETIHRHIYVITDWDGEIEIDLRNPAPSNGIYIVDEASMISSGYQSGWTHNGLLDDLIAYILSGQNNQILFVGDACQLPPVKEDVSAALCPDSLKKWFAHIPLISNLSEVVRQANHMGLLSVVSQARNLVETNLKSAIHLSDSPDVQIILRDAIMPVLEKAYLEEDPQNIAVITHSNREACYYNQRIREQIFHRSHNCLEASDRIMIIQNNYLWKSNEIPFMANGEIVKIQSISGIEMVGNIPFCDAELDVEIGKKRILLPAKLNLSLLYSEDLQLPPQTIKTLSQTRRQALRSNNLVTDPYVHALLVKPAYAMTAHKSQGGQWKTVFVDRGRIKIINGDITERRWFYTAVTRAKEKLVLIETPSRLSLGEFDYAIPVIAHKSA